MKVKVDTLISDWLTESIDPEDLETLTAFREWLRSGQRGTFECLITQEAWSRLMQHSKKEETMH